MTVLVTMDVPFPREVIEGVSEQMGVRENPPAGLLVHVITETADGVHVTDVWESAEAFEAFRDNDLLPAVGQAMAASGTAMSGPPPEAQITEAHDLVVGRSA